MSRIPACLLSLLAVSALWPAPAWSAGPLQRYALVIGANAGGADRAPLQYAVSDAERFARVLVDSAACRRRTRRFSGRRFAA
jgi:hypothetical protein